MAIGSGANIPAHTMDDLEEARQNYIRGKGRPTLYNPSLAAEICSRIEAGETLTAICKDSHVPAVQTIHDWKGSIPQFGEALARARQASAGVMVDSGLDMLDALADQPEASMVTVRMTEMRHKARFELAKAYDRDQFGDSRRIDQKIQVEHTLGGVVSQIIGESATVLIEGDLLD